MCNEIKVLSSVTPSLAFIVSIMHTSMIMRMRMVYEHAHGDAYAYDYEFARAAVHPQAHGYDGAHS